MTQSLNKITVFCQIGLSDRSNYTADWNLERGAKLQYETDLTGKEAAEDAFILTNAPEEVLTDSQKENVKGFRGPSLSVGDLVQIEESGGKILHLLCAGQGWEEKEVNKALPPHDIAVQRLREDLSQFNPDVKTLVEVFEANLRNGYTINLQNQLLNGNGDREIYLAFHEVLRSGKAKGTSPYAINMDKTPVQPDKKLISLSPLIKKRAKETPPTEEMTMGE